MAAQWNKYAATAARQHGKRGREVRPKSTTVDIHSHVAIPQAAAFVKPHLDMSTIPLAHFADATTKALSQKQEEDIRARITGYDERLADLDAMGVDLQLIMPPPNQCYYTLPLDIAVKAARMVNDGLAEYVAKADRFVALGTVPLSDGAEAARELERCMTSLGMKGAEILTNVAGRELSEPDYAPFWQKAEALGALVVIHPNGFTDAKRLTRFYFNNVIGNPLETTIALHCLIFDGVLERHPNLKILAVHGGGYLPAYSGRIDHAWARALMRTALCRSRRPATSRRSISTRSCSRRISSPSWCASTAPTTSSWERTIPSTWPNMIRSATSPRSTASMLQPSPPLPAATHASCWGFEAPSS
ncbi:MAG TPA: amidohydrolase family protein [Xanthobacteraceae bacterium]